MNQRCSDFQVCVPVTEQPKLGLSDFGQARKYNAVSLQRTPRLKNRPDQDDSQAESRC